MKTFDEKKSNVKITNMKSEDRKKTVDVIVQIHEQNIILIYHEQNYLRELSRKDDIFMFHKINILRVRHLVICLDKLFIFKFFTLASNHWLFSLLLEK